MSGTEGLLRGWWLYQKNIEIRVPRLAIRVPKMHIPAWPKVFTNLVLKDLGSLLGHPYRFNSMEISLGITLKMLIKTTF